MTQSISVIEPVQQAIATTKRLLFTPFDMLKWLGLGFTAWLAMLSGNNPAANFANFAGKQPGTEPFQAAWEWMLVHLALVIALAACLGVLILAVTLAVTWVSSRGKFMFLDNVVRDRADIAEPWRRTRAQGNSYFLFSLGLGLTALAVLGIIALISVLIAMPDILRHQVGANAVGAIILGGVLLILYLVVLSCVMTFLEDFIIPIMALRSCRALAAWREFFAIFKAHTGAFICYLLFKIVLGWAAGAISLILCCCLCCVMWIPYVGTVILLPLFVFLRCYSLHFLEQVGDEYRLFNRDLSEYLAVAHEPPAAPL